MKVVSPFGPKIGIIKILENKSKNLNLVSQEKNFAKNGFYSKLHKNIY